MKNIKNSKGIIVIDFLFSILIATSLLFLCFCLCFSLSVAEIAQYIAYSTARAQVASDLSADQQTTQARQKYAMLLRNPGFGNFFSNGWFTLSKPADAQIYNGSNNNEFGREYGEPRAGDTNNSPEVAFVGVRLDFVPKLMIYKIPFVGKTADDDAPFKSKVTAFLIREPSMGECQTYTNERYQQILKLDSRFEGANSFVNPSINPMEDNGC